MVITAGKPSAKNLKRGAIGWPLGYSRETDFAFNHGSNQSSPLTSLLSGLTGNIHVGGLLTDVPSPRCTLERFSFSSSPEPLSSLLVSLGISQTKKKKRIMGKKTKTAYRVIMLKGKGFKTASEASLWLYENVIKKNPALSGMVAVAKIVT